MNIKLPIVLAATLSLGACTTVRQSSFNPFNWFGSSRAAPTGATAPALAAKTADNRPLIAQVISMSVLPTDTGAIVRATGLAPDQGWYDAALVPENDGQPVNGTLTLRFVAKPPPAPAGVSTPPSRMITAAYRVDRFTLAALRRVTVTGAQNARSSGR